MSDFAEKEKIVKRLNERITSVIRHAGVNNEEVMRWQAKLSRPGSPYSTTNRSFTPGKAKLSKNQGHQKAEEFLLLSRSKKDIDAMDLDALKRLEGQTKGWGAVKAEARQALEAQAQMQADLNPFVPAPKVKITESQIINYINQKEAVRNFIESASEHFYSLIEATGWDDIRDHTTEEIFAAIENNNLNNYTFQRTIGEIGADYIKRRDAARERRRSLGI